LLFVHGKWKIVTEQWKNTHGPHYNMIHYVI
jgi:hypothetical protein